jgi:hypothetical protein
LNRRVGAPTGQRDVRQRVLRQLPDFPLHLLRDGEGHQISGFLMVICPKMSARRF